MQFEIEIVFVTLKKGQGMAHPATVTTNLLNMKSEKKINLVFFHISKTWQILKRFSGSFHQAQPL